MHNPNYNPAIAPDNETGRKTFFWYRVYVAALTFIYLLVAIFGVVLVVVQPTGKDAGETAEIFLSGVIAAVLGAILFLISAVALFLPRKPYNWIVGMVLIALGMTSCCSLPFVLPLLIYWLKPEPKAYFGRSI